MKNLNFLFLICFISSGFAQPGFYNPYQRNDYSWYQPRNYYNNEDFHPYSWNRRPTPHYIDSEEIVFPNYNNDDSGSYEEFYDHNWDGHNHGYHHYNTQEKECVTPNEQKAKCIPLNNCPVLKQYAYHNYHVSRFFKESICGHTHSGPLVCCGTEYKYNKNVKTTTQLPPYTRDRPHFHRPSSKLPQPTLPPTTYSIPTSPPLKKNLLPSTSSPKTTVSPTTVTLPPTTLTTSTLPPPKTNLPPSSPSPKTTVSPTPVIEIQEMRRINPPKEAPPSFNLKSHRNFNLLPTRSDCGEQDIQDKISGGEETGLTEFPWMALLEYHLNGKSSGYKCGGMLINDRYVLTAAHCVFGRYLPEGENVLRVRLGEHDVNTDIDCRLDDCNFPPQDIDIEEVVVHPGFNDSNENMFNDIALLRLRQSPKIDEFVRPICLPTEGERVRPGQNLTISGWGVTETESISDIKLKATIPYIEDNECKKLWLDLREISDDQFCAGGSEGVSACSGDSGGPIMILSPGTVNWYVEGIVSFGKTPCGTFPNVYVRVSSYINWILDNIKP